MALLDPVGRSQSCWENVQMKVVNIHDLETTEVYREFLRSPSLSLGLYRHEVGASVPQEPHTEDEVYFVVSGRGSIEIDGADHAVTSGSVVYVPAGIAHHFHDVTEALQVLVAFAPPEGSVARKSAL
jgi:mannose-6-phosphate isomerase-like protein (cupin superfamily)